MLPRFLLLPIAALLIGLLVNTFHPRAVQWGAEKNAAFTTMAFDPTPLPSDDPNAIPRGITLHDAAAWIRTKPLLILDARSLAAFQAGHVSGALHFFEPEKESALIAFEKTHEKSTPILIYCDNELCPTAIDLAYFLEQAGYDNVRFLKQYSHWQEAAKVLVPEAKESSPR